MYGETGKTGKERKFYMKERKNRKRAETLYEIFYTSQAAAEIFLDAKVRF